MLIILVGKSNDSDWGTVFVAILVAILMGLSVALGALSKSIAANWAAVQYWVKLSASVFVPIITYLILLLVCADELDETRLLRIISTVEIAFLGLWAFYAYKSATGIPFFIMVGVAFLYSLICAFSSCASVKAVYTTMMIISYIVVFLCAGIDLLYEIKSSFLSMMILYSIFGVDLPLLVASLPFLIAKRN